MAKAEMKYKTLAELKAAYDSGELDPVHAPLVLDNDCSYVYAYTADGGEDEDPPCVYRGPGYEIREEALTMCGIPWRNC